MPNKFIEKLAVDLAISCEGNTTRTQRIENALKILTSYRDEILKEIDKVSEQIQGGGNGRRILIQLKDKTKQL